MGGNTGTTKEKEHVKITCVKVKGGRNRTESVTGVCQRPPGQKEETDEEDETDPKPDTEASCTSDGGLQYPDMYWT